MTKWITQQAVFEAARYLIEKGTVPTQDSIRDRLGKGSRGTIHKYLKQWKQACFEQGGKGSQPMVSEASQQLAAEQYRLEQMLNQQIDLNKTLSQDLLISERAITKFREQQALDQKRLKDLCQRYEALEKDHEKVKTIYDAICLERNSAIEKIIQDKNRLVDKLREELKETHQANLTQIRDWSFQQEDALLQEKVKSLNYEEHIKVLKEELKKMSIEYEKAKNALKPLRREIVRERKAIQDNMNGEPSLARRPSDNEPEIP